MERCSIPDAPPAGYVPLSIAFERFCNQHLACTTDVWWARLSSIEELYRVFLRHLGTGRLHAIVCHPICRERIPIPSEAWTNAWYPERPLIACIITGEEGEDFLPFTGRRPFVLEAKLSAILSDAKTPIGRPHRRGQYPWDNFQTAFRTRVAEEGAPTTDGGEPGWRNQADVERWIIRWMLERTGRGPSEPTARRHAKLLMDSIGGS